MPICARKQTNGPPVIDQDFSTASCNCHHMLSGRAVYPPTFPTDKQLTMRFWRRQILAACYQLAEEVGGCTTLADSAWWPLQLPVESPG